ncbi:MULTISPECIES: extracellular solute-binding protein [unclassified Paenibacillus]|uniref:extracellular solute-binding protein n=1 Tax=unclassified Paenibacillus TaxID=185978 RepID=UPI000956CE0C|nr:MULTISPECIES: extracellular solute-binding protein [unclassified Paenibacillus]ASS66128.1 extracellular solute-binding protein [Paenibacillus sp. RUD330]SIQ11750.1 putative aldouronate transport system substrate-binding protein [Paenibacillus sp. RU4X]SIQ33200.1 putative aldouronate transport system substrate-binding protein [Paenibacillus sp. RU4T]
MFGTKLGKLAAAACVLLILAGLSVYMARGTDRHAARDPQLPPSEPEVTLKFYFGGDKKAATDEVWTAVSDYVKSKGLNVKFNVNFIPWPELPGKLLVMAAAGDRWDLNFDSDNSYQQMAARGSYLPLNELLPKYAPRLYEKYKDLDTLSATTVNGEVIALPWTIKMNQRFYAGWRSDLAEKAGIRRSPGSVRTVEDVDVLLHELKAAYPDAKFTRTAPLPLYMVREEWVDLGFHGLGFYYGDPKVTVRAIEQQPFYLESAEMSRRWYNDNILNRDSTIDKESAADQWRNGKMLFTITSHEWAYAADPGFSDDSYRQQMSLMYPDKRYINRSPIANVAAINRNSEHPDRVLRFLDMMETDRTLYDLVIYGIEGKTYELEGDTAVYPGNMGFATSNYMDWGGQWAFWKPAFMRPTATYPSGFWEEETRFAEQPVNVKSPVEGLFISDAGIGAKLAARDQSYEDKGKAIEYGMVQDVGPSVEAYIALQKKNGLDTVIADVQRQINDYLGAKRMQHAKSGG